MKGGRFLAFLTAGVDFDRLSQRLPPRIISSFRLMKGGRFLALLTAGVDFDRLSQRLPPRIISSFMMRSRRFTHCDAPHQFFSQTLISP